VTLPAGVSPNVGVGGHVVGGGFGFLCRQHGLAADHLYGVEVVVVDAMGAARSEVATREPSDPNRELWWAHTGRGGGNFGIVTRYWFRSPDATGNTPTRLLPTAPASVLTFKATWDWHAVDLEAGVSVRMIQQWLCHTSLTTTNRYTHLTRSAEQRAVETLEHILGDLL
jgi:hypothetical protein